MATRKRAREEERASGGLPIWARFTLSMSIALAVVSSIAGFLLYQSVVKVSTNVQEQALIAAARWSAKPVLIEIERQKLRAEQKLYFALESQAIKDIAATNRDYPEASAERRALAPYQLGLRESFKTEREARERQLQSDPALHPLVLAGGDVGTRVGGGDIVRSDIEYGSDRQHGVRYRYEVTGQPWFDLLLPDSSAVAQRSVLGLIIGATFAIILVGALVSVWIANQVARPLTRIVADVRQISTGDLEHRTHAHAGGEIGTLARAIDRMTHGLAEARETEIELQVREREVEVAGEVREQLLPQTTPKLVGYDIGHAHIGSGALGGDFLDYIETGAEGGEGVGLLVCEVSGKGLPGALVGATARSYLRAKLSSGGDVKAALMEVNKQLARDVRRGMAVTSLYALVDPAQGIATVACTGHKVPLIRYTAADKKVRLIHPEGIALGFDKGPVFDGKLELAKVPIERGDRLVLVNTGAVAVVNSGGQELGEKALYGHVLRLGGLPTDEFIEQLRAALAAHAGEAPLPRDISIVTIVRA